MNTPHGHMSRNELLALARAERLRLEQENLEARRAIGKLQATISANDERLRALDETIGHLS